MQLCSIFSKLNSLCPQMRPPITIRVAGLIPVIASSVVVTLSPGPARASTVYTGTLEPGDAIFAYDGSLYDDYAIQGEIGEQLTIQLQSDEFDPFLAIVGPQGEWLLQNDNVSATDQNAALSFTFPDNSVYHVFVNTYAVSGRGTYTLSLSVNRGSSQSSEINVPQPLVPMPPPVILNTTGVAVNGGDYSDTVSDLNGESASQEPQTIDLETLDPGLTQRESSISPVPLLVP
ncbi:hypothetical protein [Okeania sp. SIO2G5]|uniref:hypothetical protein n=1 Tax=Okeania sp. SIO2G5 TaxID=2607796 RepID=UPI0013BF22B9|nr:hypothetical protein [Okeania sp. SIO2G5]NEP76537.1 hypothetical protein [Okeania sp. SIO2G5]